MSKACLWGPSNGGVGGGSRLIGTKSVGANWMEITGS